MGVVAGTTTLYVAVVRTSDGVVDAVAARVDERGVVCRVYSRAFYSVDVPQRLAAFVHAHALATTAPCVLVLDRDIDESTRLLTHRRTRARSCRTATSIAATSTVQRAWL